MEEAPKANEKIVPYNILNSLYVISNKNNHFGIDFSDLGNYLYITAFDKKRKIEFEKKITLEEIKKIDNFFEIKNIKDCLKEIENGINNSKIEIKENKNHVVISIPSNHKKIKDNIIFWLIKKENNDEKINSLNNVIKDLKNEIYNQRKFNKRYSLSLFILLFAFMISNKNSNQNNNKLNLIKLENENINKSQIEQALNKLLEDLNERNLKKSLKENYQLKRIKIQSSIIKKNETNKLSLKKWINPKKYIRTELLYKLSRDGDSINEFHKRCDNKSPTLILIESIDGNKFGGYTKSTWDGDIGKNDGESFLFSLSKNMKYEKKYNPTNNRDIVCGTSYGPYFGLNDLIFKNTMKYCKSYKGTQFSFLDDKSFSNNKNNTIEVKEVEVFQIYFE